MKKGDLRKQEFLQTAETLFCTNGYEQTGVQEILDVLHASKGSFYHHFVSKESLLEAMFEKRAAQAFEAASATEDSDPVRRVESLLSAAVPLKDEQLPFLLMVLPIFSQPEGRSMKTQYCDSLDRNFRPALAETVSEAVRAGDLSVRDPEIAAEQCLLLLNRLWIRICETIVANEKAGLETDPGDIMHLTEQYRHAMEQILTAPYGSMTLIDLPSVRILMDRIHAHWK